MLEAIAITAIIAGAAGVVGGYALRQHVHDIASDVATAVTHAFTFHTGLMPVDATAAKVGAEVASAVTKAAE